MVKIYQLNLDLQPIKEFVYNMQKSTQLNVMKSNIGGWQSQIEKEWPKVLFGLRDFIQSKIPKQTFMTLWYNINGRGCYNLMHDHNTEEGCSGVFYIDVPDKNMGNLYFENGKEYEPIPNANLLLTVGSLYLFFNCFTAIWFKSSSSSVLINANIRSAVAGNPKLSDVSSRPISLDTKPERVV